VEVSRLGDTYPLPHLRLPVNTLSRAPLYGSLTAQTRTGGGDHQVLFLVSHVLRTPALIPTDRVTKYHPVLSKN
jgi:hypothetical protein